MNTRVFVNTRSLMGPLTGVHRYTQEVLARLKKRPQLYEVFPPPNLASGLKGHVWEQVALPFLVKGDLLFSPANTGPLAVRKQVVTIHDVSVFDRPEGFSWQFTTFYRLLLPALARRSLRVIAVSNFTKQRILDILGLEDERVKVIPNGVDQRFYPRSNQEVAEALRKLNLPSPYYVLSLSSLEPRKNLHRLLQAWEIVCSELPQEVWLVLAGNKGKTAIFRELSFKRLPPRVHFTGHIPDKWLPAIYSGAIAFVYVSLYEGFGLPPLEAMASGTPPITSNCTALPEVVGDAGLMVDPYDVEAIAWGLKRLVEDSALREELRNKGLERARQFSWDKTAELTWKVLQEAAQEG